MDDLRPDAVAARVAAWHNRHPLACRITPAQVQAIGFVALPFVARRGAAQPGALADLPTLPLSDATLGPPPSGSALRARARARAHPPSSLAPGEDPPFDGPALGSGSAPAAPLPQRAGALAAVQAWWARLSGRRRAAALVRRKARQRVKALKPAFKERLLPGLAASRMARWALRHGRLDVRHTAANPVRRVLPDARLAGDGAATTTLFLATAAVEVGRRRARVLLGDGPAAEAVGHRLYSPWRVTGAFAALALAASVLVGPPLPQVQDLAELPHTEAWTTTMAWLRRHSGNDPALQSAGPRLAAGESASGQADPAQLPSPAQAAAPAPGTAADLAQQHPGAQAGDGGPEPEPVRMAEAAWQQRRPGDAAPGTDPAELPVRMADTARPGRHAAQTALPPDDPPPDPDRRQAHAGAGASAHGDADADAAAPPARAALPAAPARPALSPALRGGLASIKPTLDEATKAEARKAVADLRAARGEAPPAPPHAQPHAPAAATTAAARSGPGTVPPAPGPAPLPSPASPPAAAPPVLRVAAAPVPPAVQRAAAGAPAYALSTRLLRTRAESDQVLVAWKALLAGDPHNPLNVSVMPAGDDWRVVCWPFASRQEADKARSVLASRGLRAETVDF